MGFGERSERRGGGCPRATGLTGEGSEQSPWERQIKNTAREGGFFYSVYKAEEKPCFGVR